MSKGMTLKQTFFGDSNMTSCVKAMKQMQSVMDGELHGADLQRVLTHLESCVNCGLKYETYLAFKASIERIGRVEPDAAAVADLEDFARGLTES